MAKKKEIEKESKLVGIAVKYSSPSCIYSIGLPISLDTVYRVIFEDRFYLTTSNSKIEISEEQITSWFSPVGLLDWNDILKEEEIIKENIVEEVIEVKAEETIV